MSDMFKVVFTGEVMDGVSVDEAKASLQKSFALTEEQIEKIFSGRPIVLKKNIDYEAAEKFKSFFDKAGAVCSIAEIDTTIKKNTDQVQKKAGSPGPQPAASGSPSPGLEMGSGEQDASESVDSSREQALRPPMVKAECTECGMSYARSEMMPYKNSFICAKCKPAFTQKLKEGVSLAAEMEYAGFWIRFGAKFIDGIIIGILNAIIGLLGAPFAVPASEDPENFQAFMAINIFIWLLQMAVDIFYVTFFLGKFAATPGKMACKIKVVTGEGEKISYLRAFGRYFAEMLSAMILGIGYLMAAFDDEKRALHDRICNTRVIRK